MSTYVSKRAMDLEKPIEDAKEPLALEVKAIDVIRASEKNSKCCAYARAAEREKGVAAAFFFRSVAYLEMDDKILRYVLPPSVQKEIVAFDRHKTMEPGLYQLSPPSPARTKRGQAKQNAERKETQAEERGASGVKRRIIHRTENVRNGFEPAYRSRP